MLPAWYSRVPHHSRRSHPHAKLRAPLPAHRFKHVCNRWCGRTRNTTCVNNRTCELLKLNAGNPHCYCVLHVYKDCRFALSALLIAHLLHFCRKADPLLDDTVDLEFCARLALGLYDRYLGFHVESALERRYEGFAVACRGGLWYRGGYGRIASHTASTYNQTG
jgi:hypothetical protein